MVEEFAARARARASVLIRSRMSVGGAPLRALAAQPVSRGHMLLGGTTPSAPAVFSYSTPAARPYQHMTLLTALSRGVVTCRVWRCSSEVYTVMCLCLRLPCGHGQVMPTTTAPQGPPLPPAGPRLPWPRSCPWQHPQRPCSQPYLRRCRREWEQSLPLPLPLPLPRRRPPCRPTATPLAAPQARVPRLRQPALLPLSRRPREVAGRALLQASLGTCTSVTWPPTRWPG
jgi:hypothetical protein